MKKTTYCYSFLLLLSLCISSCATLLNAPVQPVHISTDKNVRVTAVDNAVLIDSSLMSRGAPKTYYVPRSFNPLTIHLQVDSIQKTIQLKPQNSFAFWLNLENYGVGMLIDKDNLNRYGYPPYNYIYYKDSAIHITRFPVPTKGTIDLSLSLHVAPVFIISRFGQSYNKTGILGIDGGFDYYYNNKNYLSLNIGAAGSGNIAEYFSPGYLETASNVFASLRNTNRVGRFDLGYGINVSNMGWTRRTYGDTLNLNESINNIGIGLSLSAQYKLGTYCRIGLLYQPDLWNTSFGPTYQYQQYISFYLAWKFPVMRSKNY